MGFFCIGGRPTGNLLLLLSPSSTPCQTRLRRKIILVTINPSSNHLCKRIRQSPRNKFNTTAMAVSSVNSGITQQKDEFEDARSEMDLLIVGPGVLGRIIAEKWLKAHSPALVYGQTRSVDHHEELKMMGIRPLIKGAAPRKFPFVIFCAPPSGNKDYPGEVRYATSLWSGEGSFLFTSSSAVYDCKDNGLCSEDASIVPLGYSPRTDILIQAEEEALKVEGNVVRLAGLYSLNRGAHMYFLKNGTSDLRPDHIINLIHYEDAALLCKSILERKFRGHVFMGCDGHPLSRQEMMDQVNLNGTFSGIFKGFTGTTGPLGKKMDNTRTRQLVGWEPTHKSFTEFLNSIK